jgi:phage shock protein PspC (stress-responsive transcriptional regulator)
METDTVNASYESRTYQAPLRRSREGRMFGGVAAGLGDYLGVDVTLVRIGFAVLTLIGGAGIPLYLAGLLLIPEEGSGQSIAGSFLQTGSKE